MAALLGIDIGTSSTKVMLLEPTKGVVGVESEPYDVSIPQMGYAEQSPDMWWEAVLRCISRLQNKYGSCFWETVGIGFSGQMHGLVTVDAAGKPLRPAILWLDQRSKEECGELRTVIPERMLHSSLRNRIFTGFALPSLLWIKKHEPKNFSNIHKIMQPKDYIRYKMTGQFGAEATDASASLLFDVVKRDWAWDLLDLCGLPRNIFPECHEAGEVQGRISHTCAELTGLNESVQVIHGLGDQQAQSIGNGVFQEGVFICNIGTGGQISTYSSRPVYDPAFRTQTFCHGVGRAYTIYGAILNAGMSLKWLKNNILNGPDFNTLNELAESVPAGSEGLVFLPYLTGERTPHMDTGATGMFAGLHLAHTKKHMVRAVMEGVAFALRDCMEILEQMGNRCNKMISSGGGATSPVWLQIQADIFRKEICVSNVTEQACLGACMLAGASLGIFDGLDEAAARFVSYGNKVYKPNPEKAALYDRVFKTYHSLYQQTKGLEYPGRCL